MNNLAEFKVLFNDIDDFQWKCKKEMDDLIEASKMLLKEIERFMQLSSFQGELADATKNYVSQVHGSLVRSIGTIAQEFLDQTIVYKSGYYSLKEYAYFKLPKTTIEAAVKGAGDALSTMQSQATRVNNSLSNVRDFYYARVPDMSEVVEKTEEFKSDLTKFVENIDKHESESTIKQLELLEMMLQSLRKSVEECSAGEPSKIDGYVDGSFYQKESSYHLAVAVAQSEAIHESRGEVLDEAWTADKEFREELEKKRKEQGAWQIVGGTLLVIGGTICIVATAGAASPVVVGIGVTAGTGTVLFGYAEMYEGADNIYLGSTGDITSDSFNVIRDTVFLGDQESYDFTKNVFAFTSSVMTPIGQAYGVYGHLSARAILTIGGEVVIGDAASEFSSEKVAEICNSLGFDPNITRVFSMAAGYVTGLIAGKGLTKIDQHFNISGLHTTPEIKAQEDILKQFKSNELELENNIQKGNFGEIVVDCDLRNKGYNRLSNDMVTDINTPTHQGLDGVYYNPDGHPPYIVVESKYGSSQLSTTKNSGKQMSELYIDERLDKAVGPEMAEIIRDARLDDNYGSLLAKVAPDGSITYFELDQHANIIQEWK